MTNKESSEKSNSPLISWLKRNKELIVIILTIIGITIGYINAVTQQKQTEKQNQPIFYFETNFSCCNGFDYQDDLLIYNVGSPLKEFNSEVRGLLEITSYDAYTKKKYIATIPIIYYTGGMFTGFPKGLLKVHKGMPNNRYNLINSGLDFEKLLWIKNNETIDDKFRAYVKIEYIDIFDQQLEEFYMIDKYGGHKISNEMGEEKFNQYYPNPIMLNEFAAHSIYNRFLSVRVEQPYDKKESPVTSMDVIIYNLTEQRIGGQCIPYQIYVNKTTNQFGLSLSLMTWGNRSESMF